MRADRRMGRAAASSNCDCDCSDGESGPGGGVMAAIPTENGADASEGWPNGNAVAPSFCKRVSHSWWLPDHVVLSIMKADMCGIDNSSKPE